MPKLPIVALVLPLMLCASARTGSNSTTTADPSVSLVPGEEWGTGWRFPVGGCWTFKASRTDVSGELTVRIAG